MASILYAEVYIICMIIVGLCLLWSVRRGTLSSSDLWLNGTMITILVNFASNLLFTAFDNVLAPGTARTVVAYAFKTLYHLSLYAAVFAWCGYARTELNGMFFRSKSFLPVMCAPFVLMSAGAISNIWTHWLFEITEEGQYVRHFLFQYEMAALVVVLLVISIPIFVHAVTETDPVKRGHQLMLSAFPLVIGLAWALSHLGESIPVICVCLAVHLLCVYMSASSQQISMDKLTQVNNRQNLLGYMDYKLNNHDEVLFLLMIDVDYFKVINDTYGHLEGDAALVRVAKALKESCIPVRKRPYIARYGGDEFMIFMEGSRAEAEALCANIHETLERYNDLAGTPYRLAVSIGLGDWWPSMNVKDLIAKADAALYEVKQARDQQHGHHDAKA